MSLRVFIVDDEAPARRELRYLLELVGAVVVGEAGGASSAVEGIRKSRPQLVFLDIQMPGLNGLELASFLNSLNQPPLLVFATAFEQYALKAFEVDAIDYLRKPFSLERVAKTVRKAAHLLATAPAEQRPPLEPCRRIPLYRGEVIVPTAPEQIFFAQAREGEVIVHAAEGCYHIRWTLTELERKLAGQGFVRPHRGFLVNSRHVRELIPWFNRGYQLVMDDSGRTRIPVSRHQIQELKRQFDL